MIGKAKSITHTAASLEYAMSREQGEVLDKHFLTGETPKEIEKEMQMFQQLNGRCKNNTLSIVLSPSIEDGKRISNAGFRTISRDFLSKMGLQEHQSITVKHEDKAHTHLHIYVNRIDMQGRAFKDHHIWKDAQRVADQVAQERNLTRAKIRHEEIEAAKQPAKERVQAVFEDSLKYSETPKEFFQNVRNQGVKLDESINKQGKVQGYRVELDGESFKASEIGNKFTLGKIAKTIEKAVAQRKKNKPKQEPGKKSAAKQLTPSEQLKSAIYNGDKEAARKLLSDGNKIADKSHIKLIDEMKAAGMKVDTEIENSVKNSIAEQSQSKGIRR